MEKYYIVAPDSAVYESYLGYREASEKINSAFKDFAKGHGFETREYYQSAESLHICPTESDTCEFGKYFKKDSPGLFKKSAPLAKSWAEKCRTLELKTPRRPILGFIFGGYGRSSSRLFMINDVLYASFGAENDFDNPVGFKEIKASEFFKIVEEYEEALKKVN